MVKLGQRNQQRFVVLGDYPVGKEHKVRPEEPLAVRQFQVVNAPALPICACPQPEFGIGPPRVDGGVKSQGGDANQAAERHIARQAREWLDKPKQRDYASASDDGNDSVKHITAETIRFVGEHGWQRASGQQAQDQYRSRLPQLKRERSQADKKEGGECAGNQRGARHIILRILIAPD